MARKQSNIIKTKAQVRILLKAADITREILTNVSKQIKPGSTERDIAKNIDRSIKNRGLRRSFRTIVASGKNAARPHAKPTSRKIKSNDMIVVDLGVIYKDYHSDMTRTLIIGNISPLMRRLYKTVKTAQKLAIQKIRPGIRISDFVKETHGYIRKKGFGKYILHSLGHGIGKRIHEAPRLSENNNRILKKGMVVTIEPGLYIKDRGGIRIEDMVYLGQKKSKVLTA